MKNLCNNWYQSKEEEGKKFFYRLTEKLKASTEKPPLPEKKNHHRRRYKQKPEKTIGSLKPQTVFTQLEKASIEEKGVQHR